MLSYINPGSYTYTPHCSTIICITQTRGNTRNVTAHRYFSPFTSMRIDFQGTPPASFVIRMQTAPRQVQVCASWVCVSTLPFPKASLPPATTLINALRMKPVRPADVSPATELIPRPKTEPVSGNPTAKVGTPVHK